MSDETETTIAHVIFWGGLGTALVPGVGTVLGVGAPLAIAGYRRWRAGAPDREARRERRRDEQRREAEHQQRMRLLDEQRHREAALPPPPPPPPPPTREKLAAAARVRYEATLRVLDAASLDEAELRAARLRAKHQYLRELDRLL